MSRFMLLPLLALVLLSPIRGSAQTANRGPGDRGIFTTRLANGLQVIAVEDRAAPVVQTSMWYRFGSLYETPGKTGLAHALEHMMFRGTPTLSAGGLDDLIARLGARVNGQTDYDYTQFYFVVPADKLDVTLAIEADRMRNLSLRQADWSVERLAVLNELDGDESSPFFNLLSRVRRAAYPLSSAGRTPVGIRSDVAQARAADIATYYREWYAPNNATLVVAGDVDHSRVFADARRHFGAIPAKALPAVALVAPTAAQNKIVEAQFPFPFEVIDLAYAIPGDKEPGEAAISTLAKFIKNERGPFYQALVQSNIALALEANADTQLFGGLMHVFVILNPGHTGDEAQTAFQTVMDRVLRDGLDPDVATGSKRLTISERDFGADSIGGYGDLVGYTYGIVGEKIRDEDARLSALTTGDLLTAARRYLSKPTVVGHLRPSTSVRGGSSQKSDATVSDNFSSRVPNGPIVEPAKLRASAARPTIERSKLSPQTFTLSNGLRVIVQEKHDRPTVYIGGEIDTSPAFVAPGQEGIDQLASTLASFGSRQYDFSQVRKQTDDIGASVSLGQSFSARGFSRDFSTLLHILADGEEHPTFPESWLTLQRAQLANSLASQENISGVQIDRAYLGRLLSPRDPALRYPSAQSVSALTRQDLMAYVGSYWRPDLTSIAIVGDVSVAQVRAAVESAFGSWVQSGPKPDTRQPALPPARRASAYIGTSAHQVFVRLGQPALARTSKDYYTFKVLSELIGGNGFFDSRLWQELRQKRGLVYSVGTSLKADRDRGDLEIEMSASPEHVEAAVALTRRELHDLQDHPPDAAELSQAKTRLSSSALLDEEAPAGQLQELLDIAQNGLPLDYYRSLTARYADITPADIQRVAKAYLRPDTLIEIFAGPSGSWAVHPI